MKCSGLWSWFVPHFGYHPHINRVSIESTMMTSSNGNIFRVTGLCVGNSPVTGEFPTRRPVTRSFGAFFDLRLNKRLSKQSWGWWFETPSCALWRHFNDAILSPLENHVKTNHVYIRQIDMDDSDDDSDIIIMYWWLPYKKLWVIWSNRKVRSNHKYIRLRDFKHFE